MKRTRPGKHPLEGHWRSDEWEYDNVVYTIRFADGKPIVAGVDETDGEEFEISKTRWRNETLRFTSRMPSTDWIVDHTFKVISKNEVEHRSAKVERWIKTNKRTTA